MPLDLQPLSVANHVTRKSAYSVIRFFSVSVDEIISLNLNAPLYGMPCWCG